MESGNKQPVSKEEQKRRWKVFKKKVDEVGGEKPETKAQKKIRKVVKNYFYVPSRRDIERDRFFDEVDEREKQGRSFTCPEKHIEDDKVVSLMLECIGKQKNMIKKGMFRELITKYTCPTCHLVCIRMKYPVDDP